uniref:Uncharacterized protein n=1 Tax=Anopheles quadriannulatus TaxID=34691 RepID=A0A182XRN0_ANOQN
VKSQFPKRNRTDDRKRQGKSACVLQYRWKATVRLRISVQILVPPALICPPAWRGDRIVPPIIRRQCLQGSKGYHEPLRYYRNRREEADSKRIAK